MRRTRRRWIEAGENSLFPLSFVRKRDKKEKDLQNMGWEKSDLGFAYRSGFDLFLLLSLSPSRAGWRPMVSLARVIPSRGYQEVRDGMYGLFGGSSEYEYLT